jgi:hypothetical protein
VKFIIKCLLDIIAAILKQSKAAIYYLVNEPLKQEILTAQQTAFAYQHVESAAQLAKKFANEGGAILDVGGGTATTATLFSNLFPNKIIHIFEPLFKE